jgi:integrase
LEVSYIVAWFYTNEGKHYRSHYVYKATLEKVNKYLQGVTVRDFKKSKQREFVSALKEEGQAPSTINRIMGAVSAALRRKFEDESVRPSVMPVPVPVTRKRLLSDDEAVALLGACRTENDRRYIALALMTGARPSALIGLSKGQFDFEHKLLDLLPPGEAQVTKKFKPVIPMPDSLASIASQWEDGPVFVVQTEQGPKRLASNESIWSRLSKAVPAEITPYTLRRTVATELRKQGVPMADISGYLGHKAPGSRITELYAAYEPGYMRAAAEAMDAYWRRINARRSGVGSRSAGVSGEESEERGRTPELLDELCVSSGA